MGLQFDLQSIDRSHRVGRVNSEINRPRPIIVKFVSYRARSLVFDNKSKLKGSGILLREDLTRRRVALYRQTVNTYGVKNVWTSDGRVMYVGEDGRRSVANLSDLCAAPDPASL